MKDIFTEITFLNQIPFNALSVIIVGTCALLVLLFLKFSVPTRWIVRVILAVLRVLLLSIILFLILDPFWRQAGEKETIGVLVDTSPSMSVTDLGKESSRFELLRSYFSTNEVWIEQGLPLVRNIYGMSDALKASGALQDISLQGNSSDLLKAIRQLDDQFRDDKDLLGWFLFSDGNATDGDEVDYAEEFTGLNFPWNTVQVADFEDVPNLELSTVELESRAFVGEVLPIIVEWESNISDIQETELVIKVNGESYLRETIVLEESYFEDELLFAEPGSYSVDVEIIGVEGEGSVKDNHFRTWVEIDTRKINVLYIEAFYKEENLLKKALEEDESFVVHFSSSLIGFARERQVPFIQDPQYGFPKTKDELFEYDAVILSDVKRNLLEDDQIQWIKELVDEKGGALIMIGGVDSYGDGGYVGTEIEKMLPVEVSEDYKRDAFLAARGTVENVFVPILNPALSEHPLTQIRNDHKVNEVLWKNVPKLGGYNYVGRLKPAASLILQHPVDKSTFGPRIILAEQKFGRGRVLAFTSDVTYNWGQWFQDWRDENEEWVFARFWQNAIKWLTENRLEERASPLEVKIRENRIEEGIAHEWEVLFPYGIVESGKSSLRLEILSGERVVEFYEVEELFSDESILWKIEDLKEGDYRFKAVYTRPESKPTILSQNFSVQKAQKEARHLNGKMQILQELADHTGGLSYSLDEQDRFIESLEQLRKSHLRQHSQPFWSQPWIYGLILFLLILDWIIRKKAGTE